MQPWREWWRTRSANAMLPWRELWRRTRSANAGLPWREWWRTRSGIPLVRNAVGAGCAMALIAAASAIGRGDPGWAAAIVNAGRAVGISPYRAEPFRRVVTQPYPSIDQPDPSLPVGMHEVRVPGSPRTQVQWGVAYYPLTIPATTTSGSHLPAPAPPPLQPVHLKIFGQGPVQPPAAAVIAVGTAKDLVQVGGRFYHYSRELTMTATAYNANWNSNGRWTGQGSAIGLPLGHGIVAVDPRVIPLGSRLYVQGYGLAVAADTGSAIVGDRIDLFFWGSAPQIAAFGIRPLKVYVLNDPGLPSVPVPPSVANKLG